jgi:hypothetical protein
VLEQDIFNQILKNLSVIHILGNELCIYAVFIDAGLMKFFATQPDCCNENSFNFAISEDSYRRDYMDRRDRYCADLFWIAIVINMPDSLLLIDLPDARPINT